MIKIAQVFTFLIALGSSATFGKDGYDLWLRYHKVRDAELRSQYQEAIAAIVVPGKGETVARCLPDLLPTFRRRNRAGTRLPDQVTELEFNYVDRRAEVGFSFLTQFC